MMQGRSEDGNNSDRIEMGKRGGRGVVGEAVL